MITGMGVQIPAPYTKVNVKHTAVLPVLTSAETSVWDLLASSIAVETQAPGSGGDAASKEKMESDRGTPNVVFKKVGDSRWFCIVGAMPVACRA